MQALNLKNNWLPLALFAVVIAVVFGNALFNEFSYDDHYLILENPFIRDLAFVPKVFVSDVTLATPCKKPAAITARSPWPTS